MKFIFCFFAITFCFINYIFAQDVEYDGIIVKLKNEKKEKFLKKLNSFNLILRKKLKTIDNRTFVLDFKQNNKINFLIDNLRTQEEVEIAELNYIIQLYPQKKNNIAFMLNKQISLNSDYLSNIVPNDPLFNKLWGLQNSTIEGVDIDALRAWEITKGIKDIKIAVIDTGIDYNHPDLIDNMWINQIEKDGTAGVDDDNNGYIDDIYGFNFAADNGNPLDDHGHGTHCAGTIGAIHNNSVGVAGVMGNVSLVAIKFLDKDGRGSIADAVESVDYATKVNVDIMSNSWGGGGHSDVLGEAVKRAQEQGIIFVAAAGNNGRNNDSSPHFPSNYEFENVISVAAHTKEDFLASFSNFGSTSVDLAAPGKDIWSTVINGRYASYSGTSMATPHVSGVLGLLLSLEGRMLISDVVARLQKTTFPVPTFKNKLKFNGRINAYYLLKDEVPPNQEPDPEEWVKLDLDEVFESDHPYVENQLLERVFEVKGAKYIRAVVKKYDLEMKYDYISVLDPQNNRAIDFISGSGENLKTAFIKGNSMKLIFKSDYSINKWGFLIESIEVVYNN